MDFVLGGLAAVGAGCFTNPLEVLKIRIQLQGELKARGQHAVYYRNMFHAAYVIGKTDGILALQKGLIPALWCQLFLNGLRLGTYQFGSVNGFTKDKHGNVVFYKSVVVGSVGGILGAIGASPFFLVKTHLQSQSAESIAVGYQHHHTGMWSALVKIYNEHGIVGLFRGMPASVPRAGVGSAAQLTSFALCKEWLIKHQIFSAESPILSTFVASLAGGVAVSVAMTPFDLISTRMYNQGVDDKGRGLLYRNMADCVIKIWKTEGVLGFYKGFWPVYTRLGPHTVLCLVFLDKLTIIYENMNR